MIISLLLFFLLTILGNHYLYYHIIDVAVAVAVDVAVAVLVAVAAAVNVGIAVDVDIDVAVDVFFLYKHKLFFLTTSEPSWHLWLPLIPLRASPSVNHRGLIHNNKNIQIAITK